MEAGARQLFRSLQRLRRLPDYLQIWPGHGAGSACGKALGAVPQSTLGYERRFNWAFGVHDEDEFVRAVLAGQPDPPRYFAEMKRINRDGPRLRGEPPAPAAADVASAGRRPWPRGAPVVDTRPARDVSPRRDSGTINIPANRSFATWAGSLLPYDRDFYLIADDRARHGVGDLVRALAGIGLDRVAGWAGPDVLGQWQAAAAARWRPRHRSTCARRAEAIAARRAGRARRARARGMGRRPPAGSGRTCRSASSTQRLGELPRGRPLIVQCQTGARAAIAPRCCGRAASRTCTSTAAGSPSGARRGRRSSGRPGLGRRPERGDRNRQVESATTESP